MIPNWKNYRLLEDQIPENLKEWLLYAGSFIQRLKQHGIPSPKVQVINQSWQTPHADEREILNLAPRSYALVREVLIYSQEAQWMLARTVFPKKTLTGAERRLKHLKNRSLGSVLFKDPYLQRSEFELAVINPQYVTSKKINNFQEDTWGRRSLFNINHKNLLLIELFLPDILSFS
jgi:chorismate--pyruvate lyase